MQFLRDGKIKIENNRPWELYNSAPIGALSKIILLNMHSSTLNAYEKWKFRLIITLADFQWF